MSDLLTWLGHWLAINLMIAAATFCTFAVIMASEASAARRRPVHPTHPGLRVLK
jgi:hypothetical protein